MTKELKWMVKGYAVGLWFLVAIKLDLIEILIEFIQLLCLI